MAEYNLEERTAKFSEDILDLLRAVKNNDLSRNIISQLIRSATSIGANYMEANGASSKKDFKNKIHICKKEAMETKYWLRMLVKVSLENQDKCRDFWKEAQQLTLIFSKIANSSK